MKPAAPRISVVIAMHNAAATVADAIRSLQNQTEPSWEAFVVDDGSTDAGPSIVAEFAAADPRITLHRQANAGPAAARNAALDLCRGEFVAFLDADDWLEPGAYATLLSAASNTQAVRGLCSHCDESGRAISWPHPQATIAEIGLVELLSQESFAIHAQLIRREAMGELRFRTHLDCFEDLDFYLHLAERGVRWRAVNHVVCTYRQRPRKRGTPEYAHQFRSIESVYTDAFDRLRRLPSGRASAGVDCSPRALQRLLFRRAFTFASMMILQDPTSNKDYAARVLARLDPTLTISAEEAAIAAHGYLPWSECLDLSAWPDHLDRYALHLSAWWLRCINDGRAAPTLIDHAVPRLARRISNELDIPEQLLRQTDPARSITILGAGRNGVRMARALCSLGLSFRIRDSRQEACDPIIAASGGLATRTNPHEPYDLRAQHVMTLLDDSAYFRSLPPGLHCLRWAEVVDAEAIQIVERLHQAMHQPC